MSEEKACYLQELYFALVTVKVGFEHDINIGSGRSTCAPLNNKPLYSEQWVPNCAGH